MGAFGKLFVVGREREFREDRSRLDVAVAQTMNLQLVLLVFFVVEGLDLHVRITQLSGEATRAFLGGEAVLQVDVRAGGNGKQHAAIDGTAETGNDVARLEVFVHQSFERGTTYGCSLLEIVARTVKGRILQSEALQVVAHFFLVLEEDARLVACVLLHLVEGRLRDVDVAVLDQLGHLTVKERQKQCADVRAVNVRVGHDDDAVVAELGDVEVLADVGAERERQHADLLGIEEFVLCSLFHVEHLAS